MTYLFFSQSVYFNCTAASTVKSSFKRKIEFLCIFVRNWQKIKPFSQSSDPTTEIIHSILHPRHYRFFGRLMLTRNILCRAVLICWRWSFTISENVANLWDSEKKIKKWAFKASSCSFLCVRKWAWCICKFITFDYSVTVFSVMRQLRHTFVTVSIDVIPVL